jgi:hypothetical protein
VIGDGRARCAPLARAGGGGMRGVMNTQLFRHIVIDRAGVGHLLGNAEFLQFLYDLSRLYFQLPRQLIDPDLTHIQEFVYLPACGSWASEDNSVSGSLSALSA